MSYEDGLDVLGGVHVVGSRTTLGPRQRIAGMNKKSTILGAAIDVDGLIARFDSLPKTNNTVWSLWVENSHGLGLAQRIATDAQNILNQALVPTNEFAFHDAVLAFAKRAEALSDKVTAQHLDDNPSPIWNEVKAYFVDGSKLANQLEGVLTQSVKWTDVKEAASKAASGAESTVKWTSGLLVGGAVVLGAGVLYVAYKIATGPAGGTLVGTYLGGRR